MKVTVAIDSFKGSLSTFESGSAVAEAVKKVYEDAVVTVCPIADGGEGTLDAIVSARDGEVREISVTGPRDKKITARYGIIREAKTAIIEMAAAAGITLLDENERNPLYTTTYGVGELILDAIKEGCRKFIVGIGGSATNDGGVGMLTALGYRFLNAEGKDIQRGAVGLKELATISTDRVTSELAECEFHVACDVKNTLCGVFGCSAVYGPQKGATPDMVRDMDAWLSSYADLTKKTTGADFKNYEGGGAAGGLGYAFLAYLGASTEPGIELVMRECGVEEKIKYSDIVVTGEGRLDRQSSMGKAPVGVAALAKKYAKPVIAFAGCIGEGAESCNDSGIDAYFPILQSPTTLDDAMMSNNAYNNLHKTAIQAFRLIKKFSL